MSIRTLPVLFALVALLVGCGGSGGGAGGAALGASPTTPPVFAGLDALGTAGGATVQLDWLAAQDNLTPAAQMRYRVYAAATSGAQTFGLPTLTTAPGVTSLVLTNANTPLIALGAQVFFVVRALDLDGNEDANTVELSTTPTAAGNVAYVDATAGGPGTLGVLTDPFPTIQAAINAVVGAGGGLVLVGAAPGGTTYNEEVTIASPALTHVAVYGGFPLFVTLPPATSAAQLLALRDTTGRPALCSALGLPLVDGDFWSVATAAAPTTLDGLVFQDLAGFAVRANESDLRLFGCVLEDGGHVTTDTLLPGTTCRLTAARNRAIDGGAHAFVLGGALRELTLQANRVTGRSGLASANTVLVPSAGLDILITHNRVDGSSAAVDLSFDPADVLVGGDLDIEAAYNEIFDASSDGLRFHEIADVGANGSTACRVHHNLVMGSSSEAIEVRVGAVTTHAGVDATLAIHDNDLLGNNGNCIELALGVSAGRTTEVTIERNVMHGSESEMIEVNGATPSADDLSDGGIITCVLRKNTHAGGGEDLIDWDVGVPHGGRTELLVIENTVTAPEDPAVTVQLNGHLGNSTVVRPYPDGAQFVTLFNNELRGADDENLELRDNRGPGFLGAVYVYVGANQLAPSADDSDPSIDFNLDGPNGSWLFERNVLGFHGEDSSEDGWDMDGSSFPNLVRLRNTSIALCSGDGIDTQAIPKVQMENLTVAYNGQNGSQFGIDDAGDRGNCFVHNCIVVRNNRDVSADARVSYTHVGSGLPTSGFGNVTGDPVFAVDIDALNAYPLDFRAVVADLFRLSPGSPGVDAGDPDPAYNDPDGTRNDMGAFGGPMAGPLGTRALGTPVPFVLLGTDPHVGLFTGATLLAPAGPIAFVFTHPVAPATALLGCQVRNGGVQVPGAFTSDLGGRRLIFTPTTVLNPTAGTALEVRFTTSLQTTTGQAYVAPETLRFCVAGTPGVEVEANDDGDGVLNATDLPFANVLGIAPAPTSARLTGAIASVTDVDVFSLTAAAGERLMATVIGARGTSGSVELSILDAAGNVLARGQLAFADDPYLDFTFPSAGTYYLALVDNGASAVGGGAYELQVVLD